MIHSWTVRDLTIPVCSSQQLDASPSSSRTAFQKRESGELAAGILRPLGTAVLRQGAGTLYDGEQTAHFAQAGTTLMFCSVTTPRIIPPTRCEKLSSCLRPRAKLITNRTVHHRVLRTRTCAAPRNDESGNNKNNNNNNGSVGHLGFICFSVKGMMMLDLQSTSEFQQVAWKLSLRWRFLNQSKLCFYKMTNSYT